jgi:hypothetical protein
VTEITDVADGRAGSAWRAPPHCLGRASHYPAEAITFRRRGSGQHMARFRGRPLRAKIVLIRLVLFLALVIVCAFMAWLVYNPAP